MTIFAHSGNLGDVIYSLPTVKHFGPGEFHVILGGIPAAIRKYKNGPVFPEYEGRLSQKDYDLLAPLLEAQPYITKVQPYTNAKVDYDLDLFRGTVGQAFKTNFIETFAQTFNMPYDIKTSFVPWLHVTPRTEARFIATRTMRFRSSKPDITEIWRKMLLDNDFEKNGMFIGLPDEHADFEKTMNMKVRFYQCKDFLDMAEVIAGSEVFLSNGTFAYSIAQGLCKTTVLETMSWRPILESECFFPRDDCFYF